MVGEGNPNYVSAIREMNGYTSIKLNESSLDLGHKLFSKTSTGYDLDSVLFSACILFPLYIRPSHSKCKQKGTPSAGDRKVHNMDNGLIIG